MFDMKGKVCLVTGATNGIGKVTALELAKMGATVLMVGRNPEKTETALQSIRQASGNTNVHKLLADLSVQSQVHRLVDEVKQQTDHLDVLVNNAGAVFMSRQLTSDGIEMSWALNHLSYFLLTNLLLDTLEKAPAARIVNVASAAHSVGRIHFDDLEYRGGYNGMSAYAQSKLANIMFTYSLAHRLQNTRVTANALHPGYVGTGFATNNGSLLKFIMVLQRPFITSPEKGAQTSIYLASSPDVEGVSGQYFAKSRPIRSSSISYDEKLQRRLWQISEEMVGLDVAV